jgi:hypothetical protein
MDAKASETTVTAVASARQSSSLPPPNTLLDLPPELREQIFAHIISDSPAEILIPHDRVIPPLIYLPRRALPSIAFTNREIFKEVTLTYLRRTTLRVPGARFPTKSGSGLFNFLSSLGAHDDGFRSVMRLEYRDLVQGFAVEAGLKKYEFMKGRGMSQMPNVLVGRCTGIKEVSVVVDATKLITPRSGLEIKDGQGRMTNVVYELVSAKYLEEGMRLSRMFEHTGTFVLRLVFKGSKELAEDCGVEVRDLVRRHVEFLERCKGEQGSRVRIAVECN